MRAAYPVEQGFAQAADGTRLAYEVYGSGDRTVLLLPSWQIVHSRFHKAQIPYLSRYARVVTFDPRGSGRSDRPAAGYDHDTAAADALAVMDATATDRAALVGVSRGAWPAVILAAERPERVERAALVGAALTEAGPGPDFFRPRERYLDWEKRNAHYWQQDFRGWLEFFFGQVFCEPHSTKQIDDAIGYGLETTPEILIATIEQAGCRTPLDTVLGRLRCPLLLIHGSDDRIRALALSKHAHALVDGSELHVLEGSGHAPQARDPVRVNRLLRDFLTPDPVGERGCPTRPRHDTPEAGDTPAPPIRWRRAMTRPKRALFVSSPIGLGHVQRDLAVADALRTIHPELQIDWLAQDPVTRVLAARGERVHPASARLAGEAAHIEAEAGDAEHDLRVFYAWREMDEILLANFMVFHDLVEQEPYDLWLGDEAWEVDYFLHENPELKTAPFVWLTDFVGWLPVDRGQRSREPFLAADYNAEMIEQVARFPRVRDRAIFVGNPNDVVPDVFGPDLPPIRDWTERNYAFSGYILPADFARLPDCEALRARLGFRPDERVVLAAVGGTAIGRHLLAKVVASFPAAKRLVPELRMIVVAGPRIDPASLPRHPSLEYRAYVHNLYELLAACDLAVVQGGLSTCMELTAAGRPFIYFPLAGHFEQRLHVPYRLANYLAGRQMEYTETTPAALAEAIATGLHAVTQIRPVETDGARRAAELIAPLL